MNNGKYTKRYTKSEIQRVDLLNEMVDQEEMAKGGCVCVSGTNVELFFPVCKCFTNDHKTEVSK